MTSSSKNPIDILKRGVVALAGEEELSRGLGAGRPLRIKLGVDPTSAELHLGHSVVLSKLRAFQDLGHTAVLIIGDFTAAIGDPSGRDATRPPLSREAVLDNARSYQDQAFKILDASRTEVSFNSSWLAGFAQKEMLGALKALTVQQLMEREDFRARVKSGAPITMIELLYPVFQGYDSVAVRADVELGGTDQTFNLHMGRRLQEMFGQKPQAVMTLPLLVGTDGVKKMSKSYGNAVALQDPPVEMFGKLMSISDALMLAYYELLTSADLGHVRALHPMEAKKELARSLVARFHGESAAAQARERFEAAFSRREAPAEMPSVRMPRGIALSEILVKAGGAKSKNEARRLISQGGVRLGGVKAEADGPVGPDSPFVLQVGRRLFVRVELT